MSFKDVTGQESAVAFLKSVVRQNRIAHAYVFVGPDGVGKNRAALNFAKLLLCQDPKDAEPCDLCASCVKAQGLNHPDIQQVSPDGQFIKIDAVREACRRLNLKGFESSRKVLIISGAQHLNDESSNALLKTLEEPTPDTVIILTTDTLGSILPTIASRCQRVVFSRLSEAEIVSICCGQWGADKDTALYLARLSEGSLGKALKFFRSGLYGRKNKLLDNALMRNYALEELLDLSSKERAERHEQIEEVLSVLSSWFRDLILAKASSASSGFINIDKKSEIVRSASLFSYGELEERLVSIAETARDLERNTNMRLALTKMRADLWK